MQKSILIKLSLFMGILSLQHDLFAEGWFSDLMVRVPVIGRYWMDDVQNQIYSFEQKKRESDQIRKELSNKEAVQQMMLQFKSCNALPIPNGNIDVNLYKAKFEEYIKTAGVTITKSYFKSASRDFSKAGEFPIKVLDVPRLMLTDEEIANVVKCAKNSNTDLMKKLSRFISLTDDINTFRQSKLYQQKHVPVTMRSKKLDDDIKLRSEAYAVAEGRRGGTPDWILDQVNSKEYRSEVKKNSPVLGYYIEVLKTFKNNKVASKEQISSNLKRLESERSALGDARKKVNAYRAIDE